MPKSYEKMYTTCHRDSFLFFAKTDWSSDNAIFVCVENKFWEICLARMTSLEATIDNLVINSGHDAMLYGMKKTRAKIIIGSCQIIFDKIIYV